MATQTLERRDMSVQTEDPIPALFHEFLRLSAVAPSQTEKQIQIYVDKKPTCYGGHFHIEPRQFFPRVSDSDATCTVFIGRTTENPVDENFKVVIELVAEHTGNKQPISEDYRNIYILTIGNAGKLRPHKPGEWMDNGHMKALEILPLVRDAIYEKYPEINQPSNKVTNQK